VVEKSQIEEQNDIERCLHSLYYNTMNEDIFQSHFAHQSGFFIPHQSVDISAVKLLLICMLYTVVVLYMHVSRISPAL